jgi:transposase InsO family protein
VGLQRSDLKGVNVNSLCRGVGMSRANWYKRKKTRKKKEVNEKLVTHLIDRERKAQPRIGGRKLRVLLAPELDAADALIGRDRFFDVMRRNELLVPPLPKSCRTTYSNHSLPIFPNLIKEMQVTAPNQVWVSDITYIRVEDSFVYLTLIMDLFSRKIVGYHCSNSLEVTDCIKALDNALAELPEGAKPIHHSDRGSQYCCHEYVKRLKDHKLKVSMTEVNHCAENSHAERLNGTLKHEYGLGMTFGNAAHARKAVDQAVWLYNNRRPHDSLGMQFPAQVYIEAA